MKSKHTYEQVQVKRELKFSNCMQLQVKISQSTSNLIYMYIYKYRVRTCTLRMWKQLIFGFVQETTEVTIRAVYFLFSSLTEACI